MDLFGIGSALLIFLTSLVLGGRLMWLGRGNLTSPETLLGVALFFGGAVAFPLSAAATASQLDASLRVPLGLASYAACYVMLLGKAGFVWSVFRRSEGWAALAFVVFATLPLLLLADQAAGAGASAYYLEGRGPMAANQLVLWLCDAWATVESFRYFVVMRRRQRIGLADPLVTDRLFLWGLANLSAVVASASIGVAGGIETLESPLFVTFVAVLILCSSVPLWLAFMPPEAYREWVRSRAVLAETAAG